MAEEPADSGMDMDAMAAEVGRGLGLDIPDAPTPEPEPEPQEPAPEQVQAEAAPQEPQPEPPPARQPPKSWAKDKHELWAKLPPEAQDYYEQREKQMLDGLEQYKEYNSFGKTMREALTPYKAVIDAAGLTEAQAVQYLMNAHYRLTQGTPEQRLAAYQQLGKNLGLQLPQPNGQDQPPADPMVTELQNRLSGLESALTANQQAALTQAREKAASEVEQFASDPKHPYFDEVADDIAIYVKSGATLADAYERAVWANPVTRAKEQARLQTEHEANLKAKAKQDAEAARKAVAANVRSRDTRKAPTEPKGSMEDTMRETLSKIRDRAH